MNAHDPPSSSACPLAMWSFPLAGLILAIAAGWAVGLLAGLEFDFGLAGSLGVYGVILGFGAGALRYTPRWAVVGGVLGAAPPMILIVVGVLKGFKGLGSPQGWAIFGVIVFMEASLGSGLGGLCYLAWQNRRSSTGDMRG